MKKLYQTKVEEETKRKVADSVVKAVEQVYKNSDGKEKHKIAVQNSKDILKQKGIHVNDLELTVLLEEACHKLKQKENIVIDS